MAMTFRASTTQKIDLYRASLANPQESVLTHIEHYLLDLIAEDRKGDRRKRDAAVFVVNDIFSQLR